MEVGNNDKQGGSGYEGWQRDSRLNAAEPEAERVEYEMENFDNQAAPSNEPIILSDRDNNPTNEALQRILDEIRDGLGTSDMSLAEMVLELRRIRGNSDYESFALPAQAQSALAAFLNACTRMDDNFDDARAIVNARGITLEMALAKLDQAEET